MFPENKTYNVNDIKLNFTIASDISKVPQVAQPFYIVGADLDYNTSSLVDIFSGLTYGYPSYPTSLPLSFIGNQGTANLTDLSQGAHQLTVWLVVFQYMISYDGYLGSAYSTVSFNVDSIPPNIKILSPEPISYSSSDVPLDFVVNKTVPQIIYSLDGQQNITSLGNMTLIGLFDGLHNVTVYATDEAGNIGASQTINFTIAVPEPFPAIPLVTVLGAVLAVTIVSILNFRRHRKTNIQLS